MSLIHTGVSSLTAASPTSEKLNVSPDYAGTITFQLYGTWTGTVTFYGTIDGTNDVALMCTNIETDARVTTSTANGLFRADATGLNQFYVEFTTPSSGTVNVVFKPVAG